MSHKGIRLLIEKTAKSLGDDIQFTYARTSDFNILRDKRYPFISLDPLTAAPTYAVDDVQNYVKTWNVNMAFYELDNEGSTQEQYSLLLDASDTLVDNFINKLNRDNSIVITNINQTPFIKATADILTGYLLTFQVQALDNFNYCLDDC
jgi:hypothetical protein